MTKLLTTRLNTGHLVLAKDTKWGLSAVTYANRSQAEARERDLRAKGYHVTAIHPRFSGPRYIEVSEPSATVSTMTPCGVCGWQYDAATPTCPQCDNDRET